MKKVLSKISQECLSEVIKPSTYLPVQKAIESV